MVLIILAPLAVYLARTPQVSKGWYDDNWAYRTKYTLTNNGSAVTDRQVTLTIDTQSLISEGKLLSDCSDSGFVTQSGVVLSYYLDTGSGACNTNATVYQVIIPTIHSGTTVIYHYYGNPSARSTASLTAFSQDPFTPDTLSASSEETSPAPIAHYRLDEGYNLKQDSKLEQQLEIMNQEYSTAWYDTAWTKRQPITITNPGSALTNYQLLLTIPYDTDMQPDFDDLRFTAATDSAYLIPHWIESKTDEVEATVHVKVDSITASPFPTTIHMYYGNNSAESASHQPSVYEFYETFDGTSIDDEKFSYGGGGTTSQNEFVSIVNNNDAWDQYFYTSSTLNRAANKTFQAQFKADTNTRAMIGWHDGGTGASWTDLVYAIYFDNGSLSIREDGNTRSSAGSYTRGNWYDIKIELKATGAYYYLKATTDEEWTLLYDSSYSSETPLRLGIAHYDVNEYSHTDNWIVRNNATIEPTYVLETKLDISEYSPQDKSLGIILYDPSYYNGATPYFEALVSTDSATWALSRSVAFTNPDGPKEYTVRVRPGDNDNQLPTVQLYNLTDDSEATSLTFGDPQDTTAHLKAARLVIAQSHPSSITDTHSHQEIGASQTTTTTTYTPLTDKKIYRHDTTAYSPAPNTYFDTSIDVAVPNIKVEQQINIVNRDYSVYGTTYSPTDNSLGLFKWDANKYPGATVYLEAVGRSTHGSYIARFALHDSSGSILTDSLATTQSTSFTRTRSSAFTLTHDTTYTVRISNNNSSVGTYLQSARLIIIQSDPTKITDTETSIEVGNVEKQASSSATPLTHPKIYRYDASKYSPTPEAYFEASLRGSQPTIEQQINITDREFFNGSTSYLPTDNSLGLIKWEAAKYPNATVYFEVIIKAIGTCSSNTFYAALYTASGSRVDGSIIGTCTQTTTRFRSSAFTLTDNTDYTVRVAGPANHGTIAHLTAARLIIIQSDTTKITDTQTSIEVGNTEKQASASATPLTHPKIYHYDASKYSPTPEAYFEASLRGSQPTIEQQINIMNQAFSTNINNQYLPSDNSLGLVKWEADKYPGSTVYFEAIANTSSTFWAGGYVSLYDSDGNPIAGTEFTLSTVDQRFRSSALNLVNGKEYTARVKSVTWGGGQPTVTLKSARLIVIQSDETMITDTQTVVEVGDYQAGITATSAATLTNPKIYKYDASVFSPSIESSGDASFSATLKIDDSSDTAYAELHNCGSPCNPASTQLVAQVSHSGDTNWTYVEATNIDADSDWDTSNADEYVVKVYCADGGTDGCSANIANAKILLSQSDGAGITALETYQQQVNTLKTGATTTPTSQSYFTWYNPDGLEATMRSFAGGTLTYHYEATMKTAVGTGYARLYNSTDASAITNGVLSTINTGYERQRSGDITANLPQYPQSNAKNMDTQIYNSATNTTSVSNSWLVVQVTNLATDGPITAYADLYNLDEEAVVSGSEVNNDSLDWALVRTALPISLSSGDRYVVRTWSSHNEIPIYLTSAKILLSQSDVDGITALETYQQQINTLKTGATTTPTSQSYFTWYNPDLETSMRSFAGGTLTYHYEATMKTSAGTGYARLYNSTDASAISGSTIETTSTDYGLVRTQTDFTASLPQYPQSSAKNLDTQIYNSATNTTSVSNSWLVVHITNLATNGPITAYADLYNLDEEAMVSGSQVSVTGIDWGLDRTTSPLTLSSGDRYVVRTWSSNNNAPIYLSSSKILLNQSDIGGITALETYQQQVNTAKTGATTTPTSQSYFTWYNPDLETPMRSFAGAGSVAYHYEATMKTSAGTGYARLYNSTDASAISGSIIETTSTDYELVRTSSDITASLPQYPQNTAAKNLDTQIYNSSTNTTSVSNSWVVVQVSNLATTGVTAYADLYNLDEAAVVSGSEVSVTGIDWGLDRTASPITLSSGDQYVVRTWSSHNDIPIRLASAKILLNQSDVNGITALETYQQQVNTAKAHATSTYTAQTYYNSFDWSNFTGELAAFYEATIKTSGGTGFARLASPTSSEITTTSADYELVRSSDLIDAMPTTATDLDTQIKNSGTDTTSVANSWVAIQVTDLGNPPAYAALYESGASCTNQVSGSEVKVNLSDGWKRVRTASPITLTDATDYMVCVKAAPGTTASIANAKVVHAQSAPEGIAKVATYQSLVSVPATDTDDQYTSQSALSSYNPSNFTGDKVVYHEASLKTSAGTGYVRLIDSDSSEAITGSELTTTGTSYTRVRSDDIGSALGTGGTLDVEVKNSASSGNTTSLSSSALIINTTFTSFSIIHDSASGRLDGTMADGTWVSPSGCISGTCLEFDGLNDHIYVNDHSRLDFGASDAFSLSFWFKHPAKRHDQKEVILSKFESSGGDGGYQVYLNGDGTLTVGISDDGSVFPKDAATSSAALVDNAWHHVVAVKDESSLSLYLDGALSASTNSLNTTGSLSNNDKLFIAIDNDEESFPYLGLLDEIKIYRYARPPQGIRSDFVKSGGSKGVSAAFGIKDDTYLTASQIGHWPLDESEAGTCTGGKDACDATQNLAHGTWQSGATPTYGQYGSGLELSGGDDGLAISSGSLNWYDSNWTYRTPITLTNNTATQLTDYQVLLTIPYASGMQPDFDDLRFTSATDSALLLPYWLETKTDETEATVWVKADTIPASSTSTIHMYYGNNNISTTSNSDHTFVFFDDFEGSSINTEKWNIIDATGISVSNNLLTATSTTGWLESIPTFDKNNTPIIETKLIHTTMPSNGYNPLSTWISTTDTWGGLIHPTFVLYYRNNGSWVSIYNSTAVPNLLVRLIAFPNSTASIYYFNSDTDAQVVASTGISNSVDNEPIRFIRREDNAYTGQAMNASWDWIRVREYASTEPSFNISEEVETYNPPILNSLTSGFSVSGWFNPSVLGAVERVLVSRGDEGSEDWYVKVSATQSGQLLFSTDGVNEGESSLALPLDSWSHVVMTAGEGVGKLFVNGVQVGQVVHQGTTAGGDLAFGNYPSGGSGFSGVMDELRLYAATLTSGQVATLYRHAPGPRGYWDFNEGVRDAVYDKSGHNLTGLWQGSGKHWDSGKYGKGGSFDGTTDYVEVQGSASGIRSLSFWAKPSSLTTSLLTLGSTVSASLSAGTLQTQGLTNVAIKVNGKAGTTLSANTWSHVSLTFNPFNAASILFGKVGSSYYHGLLDDIKLFDYHLTQAQVVSHLNASHPAPGSPIGSAYLHYLLDEGYGEVANNSGHGGPGVNGTLSNGTWTNEGKLGKAIVFTASTSLTATIADPGYEHSLSLWLYPTTSAASKTLVTTGKLVTDASSRPVYGGCIGTPLPLNQWTHLLAVSQSDTSCTLYQNGALTASGSTGVSFGTTFNAGASSFTGTLDDLKLYTQALTESQAKLDYNQASSAVWGSPGTDSSGQPSTSAANTYCPPGQGTACTAPIAEWLFEENTGQSAQDTSGNDNTGRLGSTTGADTNDPTWRHAGACKSGTCLEFDGGDYVNAGNDSSLSVTDSFSIATWVKKNDTSTRTVASKGTCQSGAHDMTFCLFAGTTYTFRVSKDGTNFSSISSTISSADYQWHHIVGIYTAVADGSSILDIYVDGKKDATTITNAPYPIYTNSTDLNIGRMTDGWIWNGLIDDVKIYNYPRTPAQIAWDYNRGAPQWHLELDQAEGTTAYDSGPLSINATLQGNAAFHTTQADCRFGHCVTLDGTGDYLSTANFSPLAGTGRTTNQASWGGWYYLTTSAASKTLLEKATELRLTTDAGSKPVCDIYTSGSFTSNTASGTNPALSLSAWHHLLCTYDGATLTLYVNGQPADSWAQTGSITAASSALTAGSGAGGTNALEGRLDNQYLYNYSLTPLQIKTDINQGAVSFRD